jgi:hypothetical protein
MTAAASNEAQRRATKIEIAPRTTEHLYLTVEPSELVAIAEPGAALSVGIDLSKPSRQWLRCSRSTPGPTVVEATVVPVVQDFCSLLHLAEPKGASPHRVVNRSSSTLDVRHVGARPSASASLSIGPFEEADLVWEAGGESHSILVSCEGSEADKVDLHDVGRVYSRQRRSGLRTEVSIYGMSTVAFVTCQDSRLAKTNPGSELDSARRHTTFVMAMHLPRLEVLLVDDSDVILRRELVNLVLDEFLFKAHTHQPEAEPGRRTMHMQLESFQLDSQRRRTPFPVMAAPDRSPVAATFLHLDLTQVLPQGEQGRSVLQFDRACVSVNSELQFFVEDRIITRLLAFAEKLPNLYAADEILSEPLPELCLILRDDSRLASGSGTPTGLYLGQFDFKPMVISVVFWSGGDDDLAMEGMMGGDRLNPLTQQLGDWRHLVDGIRFKLPHLPFPGLRRERVVYKSFGSLGADVGNQFSSLLGTIKARVIEQAIGGTIAKLVKGSANPPVQPQHLKRRRPPGRMGSDLAVGGLVTASSAVSGHEPARVADGSLHTYWKADKATMLSRALLHWEQWVMVDLHSPCWIDQLNITFHSDIHHFPHFARRFTVLVSEADPAALRSRPPPNMSTRARSPICAVWSCASGPSKTGLCLPLLPSSPFNCD